MSIRNISVFAAACAAAITLAGAAQATTTVIGFDDIVEGTIATNQYNGVVIMGASVLTTDMALNPIFPPNSEPNVVFDFDDGSIEMAFSTAVNSVGGYITGNRVITLSVFDGATLLGSVSTPGANFIGNSNGLDPNIFLNLAFANITSAVFSNGGTFGNTFTLDDLTIGGDITVNNPIPEPATWAMMIAGFGLVGAAMRRRQRIAVSYA